MLSESGLRWLSGTVSLVPECVMFMLDQILLGVLMCFSISPFPGLILLWQFSNCDAVCES